MKKSVVLLLVVVLLLGVSLAAQAKAKKTAFEGTNVIVQFIHPPGPDICSTNRGGVEKCRGVIVLTETVTDDPRFVGTELITAGHNWRDGKGPWWATGVMTDTDGDVIWTSKMEGQAYPDGSATLHAVVTGQGEYEGLKAFADAVRHAEDPAILHLTGYILEKD